MRILLVTALLTFRAFAQTPSEPPNLIRLHRIGSAPGAGVGFIRPYIDGRVPVTVLGMVAISGPSETWLLEALDSFAALEDVDKALNAVATVAAPPGNSLIGIYRPGLSYRPQEAIKLVPMARYFQVSIYRIRPGTDSEFADLVKLRRAGFDSINLDRPEMSYQIISGAPSPTYIFLAPLTGLRTLDDGLAKSPAYADKVGETATKARKNIVAEAEVSRESLLLRVDPLSSYVSDSFASADPEFWHVKSSTQ